jgi:hypothetical protein
MLVLREVPHAPEIAHRDQRNVVLWPADDGNELVKVWIDTAALGTSISQPKARAAMARYRDKIQRLVQSKAREEGRSVVLEIEDCHGVIPQQVFKWGIFDDDDSHEKQRIDESEAPQIAESLSDHLREAVVLKGIDANVTVDDIKVRVSRRSSRMALEIICETADTFRMREDHGNLGGQTQVMGQPPRWNLRDPPCDQSRMAERVKKWLKEQQLPG